MQIPGYRTEVLTTSVITAMFCWYCIWLESTERFKIYEFFS